MLIAQVIADLRNKAVNLDGVLAVLSGYWSPNDGGGGLFYWDASSTAIDDGGTVIQPVGASTGRWKRLFDKSLINVKWFGAPGQNGVEVGASPSGDGADDAGVQAALAMVRRIAIDDAWGRGPTNSDGAVLRFPNGTYKLTRTILLDRCIALKGEYQSGWAAGAYLQWSTAVHGIVIKGSGVPGHDRGDHSVVEGLWIVGPSPTPNKAWSRDELDDSITNPTAVMYGNQPGCGVCVHANSVRVKDCYLANWAGDAIHIEAVTADKNANDWHVHNVIATNCGRHGVFSAGTNANAGIGERIVGTGDLGGYTVYDRSFLGNTYLACHSEGARHSYFSAPGVANCTFIGCYQETSDGPAEIASASVVIGGVWGNGINGGPTIAASIPGEGTGLLRGAIRGPQAPPIRRYTPSIQHDVASAEPGLDHTVIIDAQFSHTMIVPLPTLAKGFEFTFKRVDSNAGVPTRITCNAPGYKFEGVVNGAYELYGGQTVTIQNDGIDWHVIFSKP